VVANDANFVASHNFCFGDDPRLHSLYSAVWKRARREIQGATKVSFVGLSMHEFLDPAIRFLFKDKKGSAKIVVANKEHERFRSADGMEAELNPRSPACKVRKVLRSHMSRLFRGFAHWAEGRYS
jgi:hypothetical protein